MGKNGKRRWPSEKILQRDYWKADQLAKMTGATESQIRRNVLNKRIRHARFKKFSAEESEEIMEERLRTSISVREFADLLKVSRTTAENILRSATGKRMLKTFWAANRIRITKMSFFQWLAVDSRFGMAKKPDHEKPPDYRKAGEYLTDEEAASLAGVSVSWMAQLRRRGEFPSVRVSYHVVKIPSEEFFTWLADRKQQEILTKLRRGRFQAADT